MSSTEKPLISIIIPVYNVEKYLKECVQSVLFQSYSNYEILLINDGSTDSSKNLCNELKVQDNRITVYHKTNGGVSSARNLGINKAHGDYIIFLDSDDYWIGNDCLERLVAIAEANKADIVRGEYQRVDENGKITIAIRDKKKIENKILSSYEMLRYGIAGEFFGVLFLYRKQVICELRYNEDMIFLEDMDFLVRLFRKPLRCVYSSLCFYSYLQRNSSASNMANIQNIICSFKMSDKFFEYSSNIKGKIKHYYLYYGRMMYYWTLNTVSEDPYYTIRKEIICRCNLESLRLRLLSKTNIYFNPHYSIILVSSKLGIKLFRIKNFLVNKKKKLIG